jgi:hypothetical protein
VDAAIAKILDSGTIGAALILVSIVAIRLGVLLLAEKDKRIEDVYKSQSDVVKSLDTVHDTLQEISRKLVLRGGKDENL